MKSFFTVFFSLFLFSGLASHELDVEPQMGALKVTYRTDKKGERLDRVRFLLRGKESDKVILYPKPSSLIDNFNPLFRTVTVTQLPSGVYTLEWVVPNRDRYFEKPEPRLVRIQPGALTEVQQEIAPKKRENSFEVRAKGKLILSCETGICLQFSLTDNKGKQVFYPREVDRVIPLKKGAMLVLQIPEGEYQLQFSNPSISPKTIVVERDKTTSVHESRRVMPRSTKEELFALSVTANIPTGIFELEAEKEKKIDRGEGRHFTFSNLRQGNYRLSFKSSDPFFFPPPPVFVTLSHETHPELEVVYKTLGKLLVHTNIAEAKVGVVNPDTLEEVDTFLVVEGSGTTYLPEGRYQLLFHSPSPKFLPPPSVEVDIQSLKIKQINAYFDGAFPQ